MRIRTTLAVLIAGALIFVACQAGQTPGAKVWKIGLVTDVGKLDDKSFNEASWLAVQDAKAQFGAEIDNIVTKAPADYQTNMKAFVDRGFDIVVTSGFALGNDTTIAAGLYPDTYFIGTDQTVCITPDKKPDPTFKCEGDNATLLPKYQGLVYKEAQAGYLAGVIAASLSESGTIGTLGGINTIPPVVSYMRGYQNGALSVNPSVNVLYQYFSTDITKAFNDSAGGKAIGQQMIQQGADILFQVAGATGQGFIEAACDANVWGIGVDVDQWLSFPPALQKCVVTSAEKKLRASVLAAITRVIDGTAKGTTIVNDASSDPVGIGLSDYHDHADLITPEIQGKIDAALAGLKDGSLDPCKPNPCTP